MGVKNLAAICEKLVRYGRDINTPIAIVQWGTTAKQQTVTGTLETIMDKSSAVKNPTIIIVGEVVRLREKLHWFAQESDEKAIAVLSNFA
ncbi:hypothetical protein GCM10008983_20830 [Lentibacillus halophilus]|uniref:Uncharacterized protein n=1 Tax=Lentibacillus halophilus TaxID=295065 RepID=A0ABP3J645_9BACI